MRHVEALETALAAAQRYVEFLEGQIVRLERQLSARSVARRSSDRDLAAERAGREQAEATATELRTLLEQEVAARETLETQVAELEESKRALERRFDRAVTREAALEDETGWDDDATRRRVLRVQATRARLAKTDMSPWARLRTLRQADGHGIDLTRRQRDELDELEGEYGDVE